MARRRPSSPPQFSAIVDALPVAVLIFRDYRFLYANPAAQHLADRLRLKHRSELNVLLLDHLRGLGDKLGPTVSLFTGQHGEPFYVHVMPLDGADIALSVRELGAAIGAVGRLYRLSPREAQVVEFVLLGYRNRDIATALGISAATVKKHLTHVFDKVGVDTRTQLVSRLA